MIMNLNRLNCIGRRSSSDTIGMQPNELFVVVGARCESVLVMLWLLMLSLSLSLSNILSCS